MSTKIQEQGENNDTGKSKDIEGLCEEKDSLPSKYDLAFYC